MRLTDYTQVVLLSVLNHMRTMQAGICAYKMHDVHDMHVG